MANPSSEWLSWSRKKWREYVTKAVVLSDRDKLILLNIENLIPDGKTTIGVSKIPDDDDMVSAVNHAIDLGMVRHDTYSGNPYIGLCMPMTLGAWAATIEQKHKEKQAEQTTNIPEPQEG